MPGKKVAEKGPKIVPLPGRLRAQYVKCGRENCHCVGSDGHGPYYYRRWYSRGKRRKEYVKKAHLSLVRIAIVEHHDNRRKERESVAELQSLLRELREVNRAVYRSFLREVGIDGR